MGILSGLIKEKKYKKLADGYKLTSQYTDSSTVNMPNGKTASTNLGAIKGITSSLNATEIGYAADATAVAELNNNLAKIDSEIVTLKNKFFIFMGTTISGALYINYPPGFTYQNTVIISTMAQFAGEDYYVSCDSDRIGVTAEPTSIRMNANGSYINQKYKLTIMRIN